MTVDDWDRGDAFALGVILNGDEIPSLTAQGEPVSDESFIVLFNAWREPVTFLLPPERFGRGWVHELSTVDPKRAANGAELAAGAEVEVAARALYVLRRAAGLSPLGLHTRRHTSMTRGSNCVPEASARRRRASSVGRASR